MLKANQPSLVLVMVGVEFAPKVNQISACWALGEPTPWTVGSSEGKPAKFGAGGGGGGVGTIAEPFPPVILAHQCPSCPVLNNVRSCSFLPTIESDSSMPS